ncbi:MAG: hypothetical protein LBM96_10105 [Methanobrevibacter sp.]|nr:hypothetical protein [Candidatus Methanoflexus mossambicus]
MNIELNYMFYIKNRYFSVSINKQNFSKQIDFIDWSIFKNTIFITVKELYFDIGYYFGYF